MTSAAVSAEVEVGDDDGGDSGGEGDGGGDCCSKGDGDGSGDDESCRRDGGMSALSILPLLRFNTMKYQLLSQSHPHLVKMRFLIENGNFLSRQVLEGKRNEGTVEDVT